MLIVFSDLHLADQSTARNIHGTAFDLLGKEVLTAANNKGACEIQVVLLGDIYDLVRTDYWLAEEAAGRLSAAERPWNGQLDAETAMNADGPKVEAQLASLLEKILATNSSQALARMLNGLPLLRGQKPRVTYVIGNHDRLLHNFPSLQARLQREFAAVDLEFARSYQSDRYGVLARHGHEWDEHCHGWAFHRRVLHPGSPAGRFDEQTYRVLTIGEVITAELLSGLVHRIRNKLDPDSTVDREFFESFKDVNHLRPMTAAFHWIAWFIRDQQAKYQKYLEILRLALRDSLAAVLDSSLAKRWDQLRPDLFLSGDITDHLTRVYLLVKQKKGLRLIEGLTFAFDAYDSARQFVKGRGNLDALAEGARQEITQGEARGDAIQYVLYGHTHDARQDCFRGTHEGQVKLYVNTGTFLPFIDRAYDGHGFWTAHRMTYAFLFGPEEDREGRRGPGPTLDVWNGLRRKSYLS